MSATTEKPNIIFILTDQQSANMMSCTGNSYLKTPAMDYLAQNGTRFEKAYCTNPVCLPSRFSLMTGRFPEEVGIRSNYVSHVESIPEHIRQNTLGNLLDNAGYEVAYGGKIHLPKTMHPSELGFNYFCQDEREGLSKACVDFINKPHDKPYFLYASFINPHDICYLAIRAFAETEHAKNLIERGKIEVATLDKALERPQNITDEEFFNRYCPPLPPNFEIQKDEPEAIKMIREQRPFKKLAHENWSENDWKLHRWAYCRLTEMVDKQIGALIDAVKAAGQEENTVIIFTSDHGDLDSAHRMEHKSALYEEPAKIPLIVSQPGKIPCGKVNKTHLVSNGLDLLPTLCDYAGITPPIDIEGKSFRSLAEGKDTAPIHNHLYIESEFGHGIITENLKYVLYDEGKSREQLYDLQKDPYETENFAGKPEYKEILDNHRELFKSTYSVPPV